MNVDRIREDFPIVKDVIYFDNACMSIRPKQVIEAANEYYCNYPACAGRSSHKLGRKVTEEYGKARKKVADFIGAKQNEIVFTKNTTESLNLVAHSLNLKGGDYVITTDKEHNSNLLPWQILTHKGVKHIVVKSNEDGTFDMEEYENKMAELGEKIKLVSMVYTSNLDGYTIPTKEIIKIAHDHESLVMLDGAQAVPHKEINVKKLNVDFLAFSSHKMLGPSLGVLFAKHDLLEGMDPFMLGGDTVKNSTYSSHSLLPPPEKFEAGLQNYAGAIGLASAVDYLKKVGMKNIEKHETDLNKAITKELVRIPEIKLIGPKEPEQRGGIISFNVGSMDSHDVALLLDASKIAVRSGQHCVHSWFNTHGLKGSVRVSLYLYNSLEEVGIFVDSLKAIIKLH